MLRTFKILHPPRIKKGIQDVEESARFIIAAHDFRPGGLRCPADACNSTPG